MCIRVLASFVLFVVVVNSTNCPSELTQSDCSCWDVLLSSGTIGINCNILKLTQIQALSRISFNSRVSELRITLYGISNLTPLVFQFNNIEVLFIAGESLTSVQRDAFYGVRGTLVSLTFLDTNLRKIPADVVYNLKQLRMLTVKNDLISSLTDSLQTTSLETLILSNNIVSTIAKGAFPPTLKYLDLRKNNLSSLNGALRQHLPDLGYVFISENKIRSLQGVLEGTPKLYKLYAESNMIVTIDDMCLAKVPNLVYLHLSYNRILEIQDGLNVLPYLRELKLDHNRIDTVSETAFQNSTRLQYLKLNNNRISHLPEGLFDCLTSLQVLDLSGNFLTKMYYLSPPSAAIEQNLESKTPICDFWKYSSLEVLDISGNDLVCNERAKEILQALRSKNIYIGGNDCLNIE